MNNPKRDCLLDRECAPFARDCGKIGCCHRSPRGHERGAAFVLRFHTVNALREVGHTMGATQVQRAGMEKKSSTRERKPQITCKKGIESSTVNCPRSNHNDGERLASQKIVEANRGGCRSTVGAHNYSKLLCLFVSLYALYKLVNRSVGNLPNKVKNSGRGSDSVWRFHKLGFCPNVV